MAGEGRPQTGKKGLKILTALESDQVVVEAKCPICDGILHFAVHHGDLRSAKESLSFVNRAKYHQKCSHIIVVHIDWQGRVRRKYAYVYQEENLDFGSKDVCEINEMSLSEILGNMDKSSKNERG